MSKFFEDYNSIDVKIFKEVRNNLTGVEKKQISIEPKYLVMTHTHFCDFCDKIKNETTCIKEVKLLYGYQYCYQCEKKNIFNTYLNIWYIENNFLPIKILKKNLPKNNFFDADREFIIERSDGRIDSGWRVEPYEIVKYIVTEEGSEDLMIPVYKSSLETRELNKKYSLIELFRLNNLKDETLVIKNFKDEIEKLKNI